LLSQSKLANVMARTDRSHEFSLIPDRVQNLILDWLNRGELPMLRMAIAFFVIALIAAVLGFSGIAIATAGIAKILFYIFLVLFLLSLVSHLIRRT
jgi:uncharacterized membrane protein YtjA (UPF0391 family)